MIQSEKSVVEIDRAIIHAEKKQDEALERLTKIILNPTSTAQQIREATRIYSGCFWIGEYFRAISAEDTD